MDTQKQNKDTEQKPLDTGFGPTTTAAEVISGVDLKSQVAIVTGGPAHRTCGPRCWRWVPS
jgi:hypothetical protein